MYNPNLHYNASLGQEFNQRAFDRKLAVGIVGVGSHSYRNILSAMTFLPVTIHAMCDLNTDLLRATADQYGVRKRYTQAREMFEEGGLDAVFICLPYELHPQMVCDAFDAGLHVFVEKPPAIRVAEVKEMIRHQGDRVGVVGFKKAFLPALQKVNEVLTSEGNMPLKSILGEYRIDFPQNAKQILHEGQEDRTLWQEDGCHPLSIMMAVGGSVLAVTVHKGQHGGAFIVLDFRSGAVGTLHLQALANEVMGPTERYSFFGRNQNVVIENCFRVTVRRGIPFEYFGTANYVPHGMDSGDVTWEPQNTLATLENKALFTQGMYGVMRYFCDCVLENRPAERGSLSFALELMKVYEASLESNGQRILISSD